MPRRTGPLQSTDPLAPQSADSPDLRQWAVHWVYPRAWVSVLDGPSHSVGRDPERDIVLDDQQVSRAHATLLRKAHAGAATYVICDNGSSNGVRVDGHQRVEAALSDGMVLRLGKTVGVVTHAIDVTRLPANLSAHGHPPYIGSGKLHTAVELAERVAKVTDSVFIRAETGSGKEFIARSIHEASGRRGPFIPVNCAGLRGELVMATLFGHVKGAFTGAREESKGAAREAQGGTLFLDEIAEMPMESQALLLRLAQNGEVTPLGSSVPVSVDVRLVSASHADLLDLSCRGHFRNDLYYRLTPHRLTLPALRERKEDILALFCAQCGVSADALSAGFVEHLLLHDWPGNIRELHNVAADLRVREASHLRWSTSTLREVVPAPPSPSGSEAGLSAPAVPPARSLTRQQWVELYETHGRVASKVATATGYSASTVKRYLAQLHITND